MRSNLKAMFGARNVGTRAIATLALFCAALAFAPGAFAQGDCKMLYDATDKLYSAPNHAYSSQISGSKAAPVTRTQEAIQIDGVIYILMNGAWKKSPMTSAGMQAQIVENRKNAKNVSCKYSRDESVNGEAAAVYIAHSETDAGKADATIWISKSRGLILRQEEDLDMGDPDKMHISIRYDYSGVKAPAV